MLFVILLKIYKNIYETNVTAKKESAQIRTLSNTLLQLIFVYFLCNFKMHRVLGAKVLQEAQEQLLYHTDIDIFSAKFFSVFRNLINNGFWLCNPTDKNTCENCNNRHKNIVADVVKDIKNLTYSTGRKL